MTTEVLPDRQRTEVNTHKSTSSRNYLAATARLDVEFKVAPHVSLVPRLRVTAFPSLLDDSGLAPPCSWRDRDCRAMGILIRVGRSVLDTASI